LYFFNFSKSEVTAFLGTFHPIKGFLRRAEGENMATTTMVKVLSVKKDRYIKLK